MSETNQVLAMIAGMVACGVAVLLWSQQQLTCWLRGGHAWQYTDAARDERYCPRCLRCEYAGIEDVDGNKIWFDR
jgi:hypothetical protein